MQAAPQVLRATFELKCLDRFSGPAGQLYQYVFKFAYITNACSR